MWIASLLNGILPDRIWMPVRWPRSDNVASNGLASKRDGKTWKAYGLNPAGFDVMATLHRSGKPEGISPGELLKLTMVMSGTMTNRIDQLVKARFVEIIQNPEEKRGFHVRLTNEGFATIESAVSDHAKTQHRILEGLSGEQRAELNVLLKTQTRSLDPKPE